MHENPSFNLLIYFFVRVDEIDNILILTTFTSSKRERFRNFRNRVPSDTGRQAKAEGGVMCHRQD
jgi:hypothetical protein